MVTQQVLFYETFIRRISTMPDSIVKAAQQLNNRFIKSSILMLVDAGIVALSLLLAFWLRFDFTENYLLYQAYQHRLEILPWLVVIRWLCGWATNTYRWSFSHASLHEGGNLTLAVLVGSIIFALLGHVAKVFPVMPPRSIYALEAAFTMAGMAFIRFFPKYAYLFYNAHYADVIGGTETPAIIYGAGGNGEALARNMASTSKSGYDLVGFVDDARNLWGSNIYGIKVLGGLGDLPRLIDAYQVREVLVAVPDLSGEPLRQLVEICGPKKVKLKMVPSFPSLLSPEKLSRSLKEVDPEALLERRLVKFDQEKVNLLLGGKTVMVTGAGGSIGAELCRQTAAEGIAKLILFDLNESELYFLAADLREKYPELAILLKVGSVRDRRRLDVIMGKHRPHIVFHAAAHKHVPLMEESPCEAIKNNVVGTYETAAAALANGAESFTLVSTDKAVASANVMGASKALAEFIVKKIAERGEMRCSTVRFGNVLGSNGSLLQIIQRQIAVGGPVTVTHRDMTRYFMAIPEAVALILMATALREGRTYILDMGLPINVDRLVRQVVMLSGHIPDVDMEIRYTRPRPGEKLYEELHTGEEKLVPSSFPRIRVVASDLADARDLDAMLAEAHAAADSNDKALARKFLEKWVPDFTSER